jgi:hypothetical protein
MGGNSTAGSSACEGAWAGIEWILRSNFLVGETMMIPCWNHGLLRMEVGIGDFGALS